MVTTTGFSALARFTGKAGGVDDLAIAEYPGPLGIHDAQTIARNLEGVVEEIAVALTQSSEETRAAAVERDPGQIVFSGSVEEIAHFFMEKGWSDGLPLVPPTVARIEEFLRYTDRAAHEQIAVLPSANLRATPWAIAANAVMAGCAPVHMPLLIAAVEALGDERASLNNIGSSSGIFPFVLVNGPLAHELGIACGGQAISRDANPALGRAIGLIVRNIAGFRPGASYMGTFGYPLAFALAENEAESPWPPFHVEHGYEPGASTVTVGVTNNWGSAPAPYDTPDKGGAEVALELLSREIVRKTRVFNFPARGPKAEGVMLTLLLSPPVAKSLAAAGYSKYDVKRHLYENTKMTLREFEWVVKYTMIERTTVRERVEAGVLPEEFLGRPGDEVRILSSPDILHVVVCGDPHRNRVMVLEGGHTRPTTRPIVLPQSWSRLRNSA
ncbi:MAG TPA: hypothetical protein VFZ04_22165 [Longimicrobiales bacterium]